MHFIMCGYFDIWTMIIWILNTLSEWSVRSETKINLSFGLNVWASQRSQCNDPWNRYSEYSHKHFNNLHNYIISRENHKEQLEYKSPNKEIHLSYRGLRKLDVFKFLKRKFNNLIISNFYVTAFVMFTYFVIKIHWKFMQNDRFDHHNNTLLLYP